MYSDVVVLSKNGIFYYAYNEDAFSLNNTETKFTLAVGLMTADEVIFAGGSVAEEMSYPFTWYYNNATDGQSIIDTDGFWTMTPSGYNAVLRICITLIILFLMVD